MKRVKSIALQLLVAVSIVATSCNDGEGASKDYEIPGTIYVAGAKNSTSINEAVIWKSGLEKVQGSYSCESETASLYVTESEDIYTAVNLQDGLTYSVVVLENSVEKYVLVPSQTEPCEANRIIVMESGAVIVCGYKEVSGVKYPIVWYNGVEYLTFGGLQNAEAVSVLADGDDLCTLINQYDAQSTPTSVLVYRQETLQYELQNGSYPTCASDFVMVNNIIYSLTNETISSETQAIRVWANGLSSVNITTEETISVGNSIFVTDYNDIIIGGYTQLADMSEGKQAKVWLSDYVQYSLNGGATDAEVKSLVLFDNYLYSAGYTYHNQVYKPLVWMENSEYSTLMNGGSAPVVNQLVIR